MDRDEILASYRPIRAGIQRVLRLAESSLGRADLTRAIRQVAPWAEQEELVQEGVAEMLADIALFEPNQRGRRAFDRFLADKGERLDAADHALAQRMAGAFFSTFRLAGRHEAAGFWLDDMLNRDHRLWLVDEALEASAPGQGVIAMRLFDAGPFHAGFGVIVMPDEETVGFCLDAVARGAKLPFRHSLAATLYGDQLRDRFSPGPSDPDLLEALAGILDAAGGVASGQGNQPARPRRKRRPRGG